MVRKRRAWKLISLAYFAFIAGEIAWLVVENVSDYLPVDVLAAACLSGGLPPSQVILEITESAMLADNEATVDQLDELRKLGVRLAVDDFGTGSPA